jgi:hypothetical protein
MALIIMVYDDSQLDIRRETSHNRNQVVLIIRF